MSGGGGLGTGGDGGRALLAPEVDSSGTWYCGPASTPPTEPAVPLFAPASQPCREKTAMHVLFASPLLQHLADCLRALTGLVCQVSLRSGGDGQNGVRRLSWFPGQGTPEWVRPTCLFLREKGGGVGSCGNLLCFHSACLCPP